MQHLESGTLPITTVHLFKTEQQQQRLTVPIKHSYQSVVFMTPKFIQHVRQNVMHHQTLQTVLSVYLKTMQNHSAHATTFQYVLNLMM